MWLTIQVFETQPCSQVILRLPANIKKQKVEREDRGREEEEGGRGKEKKGGGGGREEEKGGGGRGRGRMREGREEEGGGGWRRREGDGGGWRRREGEGRGSGLLFKPPSLYCLFRIFQQPVTLIT